MRSSVCPSVSPPLQKECVTSTGVTDVIFAVVRNAVSTRLPHSTPPQLLDGMSNGVTIELKLLTVE
jgi:hypothetical protein